MSPATTWAHFPVFQNWLMLLYGLIAIALWHAPIYGWLLLVSGWARRATFLWAVLPLYRDPNLREDHVRHLVFRLDAETPLDGIRAARLRLSRQDHPTIDSLSQLTPGQYLSSPGLWIGLLVAAAFLSRQSACAVIAGRSDSSAEPNEPK